MNSYLQGTVVTVATYSGPVSSPTGGFRDPTGTLADPTVVTLEYRPGHGQPLVTIIYPDARIVRDGTGLYRSGIDTTPAAVSDVWTYEWIGTGAVQAPARNAFAVDVPLL